MELNDLILLAAASIYSTSDRAGIPTYSRKQAVTEARLMWQEVLRQDKEEENA